MSRDLGLTLENLFSNNDITKQSDAEILLKTVEDQLRVLDTEEIFTKNKQVKSGTTLAFDNGLHYGFNIHGTKFTQVSNPMISIESVSKYSSKEFTNTQVLQSSSRETLGKCLANNALTEENVKFNARAFGYEGGFTGAAVISASLELDLATAAEKESSKNDGKFSSLERIEQIEIERYPHLSLELTEYSLTKEVITLIKEKKYSTVIKDYGAFFSTRTTLGEKTHSRGTAYSKKTTGNTSLSEEAKKAMNLATSADGAYFGLSGAGTGNVGYGYTSSNIAAYGKNFLLSNKDAVVHIHKEYTGPVGDMGIYYRDFIFGMNEKLLRIITRNHVSVWDEIDDPGYLKSFSREEISEHRKGLLKAYLELNFKNFLPRNFDEEFELDRYQSYDLKAQIENFYKLELMKLVETQAVRFGQSYLRLTYNFMSFLKQRMKRYLLKNENRMEIRFDYSIAFTLRNVKEIYFNTHSDLLINGRIKQEKVEEVVLKVVLPKFIKEASKMFFLKENEFCIDIDKVGVHLQPCNNISEQSWSYDAKNRQIKYNGLCLQLSKESVLMEKCDLKNGNQQWVKDSDKIKSYNNELCLFSEEIKIGSPVLAKQCHNVGVLSALLPGRISLSRKDDVVPFADEKKLLPPGQFCDENMVVVGLQCSEYYCDNIAVVCSTIGHTWDHTTCYDGDTVKENHGKMGAFSLSKGKNFFLVGFKCHANAKSCNMVTPRYCQIKELGTCSTSL
eukprot:Pgem_evm2s6225